MKTLEIAQTTLETGIKHLATINRYRESIKYPRYTIATFNALAIAFAEYVDYERDIQKMDYLMRVMIAGNELSDIGIGAQKKT